MLLDSPDSVQGHSHGGVGRRQAPGGAQHPLLRQGQLVAADEWGVAQGGGVVEERPFGLGGLEEEQHQGLQSPVVAPGVVGLEIAPVPMQALGHPLRRDGTWLFNSRQAARVTHRSVVAGNVAPMSSWEF